MYLYASMCEYCCLWKPNILLFIPIASIAAILDDTGCLPDWSLPTPAPVPMDCMRVSVQVVDHCINQIQCASVVGNFSNKVDIKSLTRVAKFFFLSVVCPCVIIY